MVAKIINLSEKSLGKVKELSKTDFLKDLIPCKRISFVDIIRACIDFTFEQKVTFNEQKQEEKSIESNIRAENVPKDLNTPIY